MKRDLKERIGEYKENYQVICLSEGRALISRDYSTNPISAEADLPAQDRT